MILIQDWDPCTQCLWIHDQANHLIGNCQSFSSDEKVEMTLLYNINFNVNGRADMSNMKLSHIE